MGESNKLKKWLKETHGRYSGWFIVVSVVLCIIGMAAFFILNFAT